MPTSIATHITGCPARSVKVSIKKPGSKVDGKDTIS